MVTVISPGAAKKAGFSSIVAVTGAAAAAKPMPQIIRDASSTHRNRKKRFVMKHRAKMPFLPSGCSAKNTQLPSFCGDDIYNISNSSSN